MQGDFVIQVRQTIDLDRGQFQGRVEHIDSGRSIHFRTVEDFLAFVVQQAKADPATAEPSDRA